MGIDPRDAVERPSARSSRTSTMPRYLVDQDWLQSTADPRVA